MPSGKFIILRAKSFKESDLILEAISKEGERVTLTAKNAVKSRKRFAGGVLEPLNFVEFFFTQAKSGFFYIQEARIIYPFQKLRDSYAKLELAFYFLKLIAKGTHEGLQDNKSLFDLLGNSLKALESTDDLVTLKIHFEVKYLHFLGFLEEDPDFIEFTNKPINAHQAVNLTNDEQSFLLQKIKIRLHQVENL